MVTFQTQSQIDYPDCDGQPMANNTMQFRWILVLQQNLDWLFAENSMVFVAGDLFWYPLEGRNTIATAPDVMVVFGRPKQERRSYKQWEEDNIPPQVVFEILSPSNSDTEMGQKLLFYDHYGVEEYYIYNPETNQLVVWLRGELGLAANPIEQEWSSPRLGIRFDLTTAPMQIYRPDGQAFLTYLEVVQRAERAEAQLEQERQQVLQSRQASIRRLLEMGLTPAQVAEALEISIELVQ